MTSLLEALLAALAFGLASVLQHRSAGLARTGTGAVRLLLHLLAQPGWIVGLAASGAGLVLHGLALHGGQVVLVQPVLAGGCVVSLVLGAALGSRLSRAQWGASAGAVIGLTLFLLTAGAADGTRLADQDVLAVGVVLALVVSGLARVLTQGDRAHDAMLLAGAAGIGFGVTGVLLKQVVDTPPHRILTSWPVYALAAVGLAAAAQAQAGFQRGTLVETLPLMTVLEPVVAVALGTLAFGETLAGSAPARAGQLLGLVITAASVTRLALLAGAPSGPGNSELAQSRGVDAAGPAR